MLKFIPRSADRTWFDRPEGMPEALHRLLIERGISSEEEAERFLNPDARSLIDPLRLSGMAEAAARVRAAMAAGEAVCVYGDYDVDGVCASAMLAGWLQAQGAEARVYLPSRHSEGYGLNEAAVREIAGWAKLMVTVDCGVTSTELIDLAKRLGLDVIVTDHHEPGEALPDCPVVNPLLGDYPFPYLCGAGVAWKLVWALGGEDAAMAWVDVAALATVADVVPLTGENRAVVRMGLDRINAAPRPGIAALIESAGLSGKRVTSTSVAFQLAPRLNAGGRLGSAMRSYALLAASDAAQARPLAEALEEENARRRQIEKQILEEAEAQLADFNFTAHGALVLAGANWNPGVIGLAASRLVEKYHYPAILLAGGGEWLTGSCRSIPGVDIHAALCGCADWLERFGGHRQAAGLTLAAEKLEGFRATLDGWLAANVDPNAYIPVREYDDGIEFAEITPGLVAALDAVQPTGFGNPAPVFRATADVIEARAVGADGAHLKLTLAQGGRRLGGIAFREGARAEGLPGRVDALFVPTLNRYMGRAEAQLEVRALAGADALGQIQSKLALESKLQCDFLTEILYNKKMESPAPAARIDVGALCGWMAERPQGALAVTADLATAARLLRQLEPCRPDLYFGQLPDDPRMFNAVCVCPPAGRVHPGCRRVVLAGVPAEYAPEAPGAARYRLCDERPAWTRALPDLESLRAAYRALMRVGQRPAWCRTLFELSHLTADEAGMPDVGALAAILAMADMGLFELALDGGAVRIRRCEKGRAEPDESPVWRAIQRWRAGNLEGH